MIIYIYPAAYGLLPIICFVSKQADPTISEPPRAGKCLHRLGHCRRRGSRGGGGAGGTNWEATHTSTRLSPNTLDIVSVTNGVYMRVRDEIGPLFYMELRSASIWCFQKQIKQTK